jgi:hypothetical protein
MGTIQTGYRGTFFDIIFNNPRGLLGHCKLHPKNCLGMTLAIRYCELGQSLHLNEESLALLSLRRPRDVSTAVLQYPLNIFSLIPVHTQNLSH